jgi:hypothetical protein
MSDSPQSYAFPQRAPIFTAIVVICGILLFGYFLRKSYQPAAPVNVRGNANPAEVAEDLRWKYDADKRAEQLRTLRADAAAANSYGWVDQKAGIARLPIDRAIELTVRDSAKK